MEDLNEGWDLEAGWSAEFTYLVVAFVVCLFVWRLLKMAQEGQTSGGKAEKAASISLVEKDPPTFFILVGQVGVMISVLLFVLQQFSFEVGLWTSAFVKVGLFSLFVGVLQSGAYDDGFEHGAKSARKDMGKRALGATATKENVGANKTDIPDDPRG
jgi:hypothetical protein